MTHADFPRLLVIGATGPTGREVLAGAARIGRRLRALARRPEALAEAAQSHEIVGGDILDKASLKRALNDVDVVLSLLGTPLTLKPVTLLSDGTRTLVAAMRETGCNRLICVTGMGAGDSRGHGGFVYDHLVLPLLLGRIYADKDRQEAIVRDSGMDWTLVRPAMLNDSAAKGRCRALTDLAGQRLTRISRKDVAEFLLGEARTPRYVRQTVNLSD
jgi:uncharacterized protein YbjT (DUF2867 family)